MERTLKKLPQPKRISWAV